MITATARTRRKLCATCPQNSEKKSQLHTASLEILNFSDRQIQISKKVFFSLQFWCQLTSLSPKI